MKRKRKIKAIGSAFMIGTLLIGQTAGAGTLVINGSTGGETSQISVPTTYKGHEGSLVAGVSSLPSNSYGMNAALAKITSPTGSVLYNATSTSGTNLPTTQSITIPSLSNGNYTVYAGYTTGGGAQLGVSTVTTSYIVVYGINEGGSTGGGTSTATTDDGGVVVVVNNTSDSDDGLATLVSYLMQTICDMQQA